MIELALLVPAAFYAGFPFPHESSRGLLLRLLALSAPLRGPKVAGAYRRIASLIPAMRRWDEREVLGNAKRPSGLVDVLASVSLAHAFAAYRDSRFLVYLNSTVAAACAVVALGEPETEREYKPERGIDGTRRRRVVGPCGNSAYLESYLLPSAFLACSLGFRGQMLAAMMLLAAVRTESKALYVGLLGGFFGYALKSRTFPLVFALALIVSPFVLLRRKRPSRLTDKAKIRESVGGRRYLYGLAWRTWKRHRWTGLGFNRFPFAVDEDGPMPADTADALADKAHSTWLETLACTGLVGTLGLAHYWLRAFGRAHDPHVAAGLMCHMFQSAVMFENPCSTTVEALLVGLANRDARPGWNPWPTALGVFLPNMRAQAAMWRNTRKAAENAAAGRIGPLKECLRHPIDIEAGFDLPLEAEVGELMRRQFVAKELTPAMRITYGKLKAVFGWT